MMRTLSKTFILAVLTTAFLLLPAGCGMVETRVPMQPWRFVAVADNRGGNPAHRAVMQSARRDGAEMILNIGDIVYPKEGHHWDGFMSDMRAAFGDETDEMLVNYFLTAGGWEEQYINQEQRKDDPTVAQKDWTYAGSFAWPGYEPDNAAGQRFYHDHFKYKERADKKNGNILDYDEFGDYHAKRRNVHVLSLYLTDEWHRHEKCGPHDNPAFRRKAWEHQIEWLEQRLAWIRKDDPGAAIVVIGHDRDWLDQKDDSLHGPLTRLLAEHRVDLALCGDEHIYKFYPDPITIKLMVEASLTKGKGGYMRVTVDDATMKVEHCDEDGKILDSFEKKIGGPTGG